jgi:hypothetical protein
MNHFFSKATSISASTSKPRKHHVFGLQLMLTEEKPVLKGGEITKTMAFHMDFQDVTLRYDAMSSW